MISRRKSSTSSRIRRRCSRIVERGQEVYRAHAWSAERLRFVKPRGRAVERERRLSTETRPRATGTGSREPGMIGVAVQASERVIAAEFFELFKTPWEFCRDGGQYDVVLSTSENYVCDAPQLLLILSGEPTSFDMDHKVRVNSRRGGFVVSDEGKRLPIYGRRWQPSLPAHFPLNDEATQEPAAFARRRGNSTTVESATISSRKFAFCSRSVNLPPTRHSDPGGAHCACCVIGSPVRDSRWWKYPPFPAATTSSPVSHMISTIRCCETIGVTTPCSGFSIARRSGHG